jgi:hypothetical protein
MKKYLSLLLIPGLLTSLTGCGPAPSSIGYPNIASPSASPDSGNSPLSSLLAESVISKEELQLRDTLKRKIELKFPIRIGVIYYSYTSQLESQEQQKIFEQVQKSFKDSGLIRETFQIPSSLLGNNANVDTLRQLGARFQADVVVIVSGSHQFEKARNQSLSFFDSFTDKANYESTVTIDAIGLDIFSGTFLSPLRSVIKTNPEAFDRSAPDYSSKTYAFRKEAETQVWQDMSTKFLDSLKSLKTEIENRPPEPAPSATPIPTPSITPFPAASAAPTGGN